VVLVTACSKPASVGVRPDPTPSVSGAATAPTTTRGVCIWTFKAPIDGLTGTCRDDATTQTCVKGDSDRSAVFMPEKKCPDVGFACLGNGFDAAYRPTNPDGTCPPGSAR
jgi:hypothetical protein